jgi:hypothetical protein
MNAETGKQRLGFFVLVLFMILGFELRAHIARKALYYLSYTASPFCFSCFSHRILWFLPGQVWTAVPPIYTSQVTGITNVNHHAQLFVFRWDLANFLPGFRSVASQSLPHK